MTNEALNTVLSRATNRQVYELSAAQLGIRNLISPPEELPKAGDRVYKSNEKFWHALISEQLRATVMVTLEDFWLSEWFPQRPGLFHTRHAQYSRENAERHLLTGPGVRSDGLEQVQREFERSIPPEIIERFRRDVMFVYDPYGKAMMLDGGIGCIRLKRKRILEGDVWFMGASSYPVAHQGIPVALPDRLYSKFIDQLAAEGSLHCTLTGRLTHIPAELDPLYRNLVGIPQLYVSVEQLKVSRRARNAMFMADGAVMIEAEENFDPPAHQWGPTGTYTAFVSFYPGIPNTVNIAAEWLEEVYVGELLRGRVITDFDEQVRRFSGTIFGLEQVMNGQIPAADAKRLLNEHGTDRLVIKQFNLRINTVNGDIRNVNITGDGNVVGDGNIVATDGSAAAAPGGAAAVGTSAAAALGATATVKHSSESAGFVERAKTSRLAKASGVTALIAIVAATVLLGLGVTDIGISGYAVAVIAVIVGIIPLFSK